MLSNEFGKPLPFLSSEHQMTDRDSHVQTVPCWGDTGWSAAGQVTAPSTAVSLVQLRSMSLCRMQPSRCSWELAANVSCTTHSSQLTTYFSFYLLHFFRLKYTCHFLSHWDYITLKWQYFVIFYQQSAVCAHDSNSDWHTALGMGSTPLLQWLGWVSLLPSVGL